MESLARRFATVYRTACMLLTTSLVLFGLLSAGAPADYDRLVSTARAYVEIGRVERALDLANTAIQTDASRPEGYVVLGRVLASGNQLKPAIAAYERALKLGSRDRQLFVELASSYDVMHRYPEAVAVYRNWLETNPQDAEMHQELGLTLLILKRFDEAVASFEHAAKHKPNDLQILQDLGYAALLRHDLDAASITLERVVAADPKRPEARRLLAQVRAAQGRPQEALALLEQLLSENPDNPRAQRMRARLRYVTGNAKGALDDYQALLTAHADDAGAMLGAAGALIALAKHTEAAPLVTKAREQLGDNPETRFRQAQIAWRDGDKAALTELRKLTETSPNATEIWQDLLLAAKKFGNRRLAAEAQQHLKNSD